MCLNGMPGRFVIGTETSNDCVRHPIDGPAVLVNGRRSSAFGPARLMLEARRSIVGPTTLADGRPAPALGPAALALEPRPPKDERRELNGGQGDPQRWTPPTRIRATRCPTMGADGPTMDAPSPRLSKFRSTMDAASPPMVKARPNAERCQPIAESDSLNDGRRQPNDESGQSNTAARFHAHVRRRSLIGATLPPRHPNGNILPPTAPNPAPWNAPNASPCCTAC